LYLFLYQCDLHSAFTNSYKRYQTSKCHYHSYLLNCYDEPTGFAVVFSVARLVFDDSY
jgi:hypothetical protein